MSLQRLDPPQLPPSQKPSASLVQYPLKETSTQQKKTGGKPLSHQTQNQLVTPKRFKKPHQTTFARKLRQFYPDILQNSSGDSRAKPVRSTRSHQPTFAHTFRQFKHFSLKTFCTQSPLIGNHPTKIIIHHPNKKNTINI